MKGSILPRPQVVVLAAGFSSRLGRSKALLRIRGTSLLQRTVRLTAPFSAARPIVVVPPRAARYRRELRSGEACFVSNRRRAAGLSTSVVLGVRRSRYAPAALLLPVDLERLSHRDLARLVSRWRAARRRVTARRVGRRAATPLILPRWRYPAALQISGDQGLRTLLAGLPPEGITLVDLSSAAFDLDTRADLAQARRRRRPVQGFQA